MMHEKNDEALDRPSHGRSAFGPSSPGEGLDRVAEDFSTFLGDVTAEFNAEGDMEVHLLHGDPFFRELESAWNEGSRTVGQDPHAAFDDLVANSPHHSREHRAEIVSSFLSVAACALRLLQEGDEEEVPSLELRSQRLATSEE